MTHTQGVTQSTGSLERALAEVRDSAAGARSAGHGGASDRLRRRWTVLLVITVWSYSVLPRLLQSLTAPKFRSRMGEVAAPNSAIASLSLTALTLAVLGVCAAALVVTYHDHRRRSFALLSIMLAPWVYLVIRDAFVRDMPTLPTLIYPAVVGAVWAMRPRLEELTVLGYLGGLAAAISVALGLAWPDRGVFRFVSGELVLEDKATVSLGILIGFLTHGNSLGAFLALGLPALLLIPARRWRWIVGLMTVAALYWSASRSSFLAVGTGAVAWGVLVAAPRALRRVAALLIPPSIVAVMVVIPWVNDDPQAFTNRGFIWAQSLDRWWANPWLGLGSGWYGAIGQTSSRISETAFHGHNQMVHVLVTGGLVLAGLTVVLVGACAARAARHAASGHYFAAVFLTVLLTSGMFERPLAFVDNFNLTPVMVLPLAFILLGEAPGGPDRDPAGFTAQEATAGRTP